MEISKFSISHLTAIEYLRPLTGRAPKTVLPLPSSLDLHLAHDIEGVVAAIVDCKRPLIPVERNRTGYQRRAEHIAHCGVLMRRRGVRGDRWHAKS